MHLARLLVATLGVGAFFGVGQLTKSHASPSRDAEQCVAFCRACDKCYATDEVAKASCNYLVNGSQQGADDCEAECAAGITPSAVARGGFGDNWRQMTCEQWSSSL